MSNSIRNSNKNPAEPLSELYSELSDKIIDLESKLAFQEHTIQELNDVVTNQQTEMMLFKKQLIKLNAQLENHSPSNIADASQETPPPHY